MIAILSPLWLPLLAVIGGFIGVLWSADRFVSGGAALAHHAGVSKLVIGLTIVSFGTSAPEIVVSFSAALRQAGELAVGNALGSNIANIALVLAITALIAPLPVKRHLSQRELPVLLAVTALSGALLVGGHLHAWEGWLLLAALPLALYLLMRGKTRDLADQTLPSMSRAPAILWFIVGLALLIASAEVLVWGAQTIALALGVSPLIVGLTVIAVGTSLPELAASVVSALRGHHDIALGNIIGSNIFNLLMVMAIPAVIQQPAMAPEVFTRDFITMAAITLILVGAIVWALRRPQAHLGRALGVALLASYCGYYVWLFSG
ncbi:calcium/sodium antiporter [Marinimicrobium alkaliphilum]|uniref:calcium/sodium antiporter n=1 Tax=Marinimicrobium alkaliphilum TaxID=2202654 RepID=UPI000DB9D1E6|nr:calcium/sodium antiporter [Marinimicrobium alkaliphilum]